MAIRTTLWNVLLLAPAWAAFAQPASPTARLDQLKAKGVNAEITVFPVRLGPRTIPEVGEVLAILLEKGGMQNVDWTTEVFSPAREASWEQTSTGFGDYVRRSAKRPPYSLYAEILFAPGVGMTEVRGLIVDQGGMPVWSYRQTPQDEEFKKAQPREPLECIVMLVNSLRGPLALQDPLRPDAFEGRLAKRNAERTGLPTNSERKSMQQALLEARAKFAASRVVVFPVLIDGQLDRKQAAHLAAALQEAKFGLAEVAATQPAVQPYRGPNEQQRLWQMARAVREHLRQAPVAADYAVFADYAFGPGGNAFTVHFIVCDRNGEWIIVDFQNDHWPDFKSMELKSGDDCDRLVIKRLEGLLRRPLA